jgi:chromosome segregation ATPase
MAKDIRTLDGLEKDKRQLREEIVQLKEYIKGITTEMYEEKRKLRTEQTELEHYYRQQRQEEQEKLRAIEYKCMMTESELSNFKSMEQYLQNESRSMRDEEELFNSIRDQIDKINADWSRLDNQRSIELEQVKEQLAAKAQKIAELEYLLDKSRQEASKYKRNAQGLEKQLKDKADLQERVKTSEGDRQELIEKNFVLEALTLTQKHRQSLDVSERIGEFERRIHLLLDDKGQHSGVSSLQQIIILKSYIRELSDILNDYKKREHHLVKSKSSLKAKQKQTEE